ncbi:MAG: hypothetical protein OEM49_11425 [Myxococcales bacterium]|nr:hypothetical protein [Myxococcales bacterium]MDH5307233.1 hypothetical protein [Myxococcales bacterium]MDH5566845.1 hypothetical protein [Myxococcales bacterium]
MAETLTAAQILGRAVVIDLDRRLAHVLESPMRRRIVRDALLEVGAEASCEVLAEVERRPPGGDRVVLDRLRETLRDLLLEDDPECSLPYELRCDIYACARRHTDDTVTGILRSLPVREPHELARLPRELSEIPLGRRRSLALGDDPRLLELLARDVDPIVIEHLLRNPRMREAEVVRIAALRPVATTTLEEIFRSERWSHQPRVRVALARNPYCPASISMRLIGALPLTELREMRSDPGLREEIRAAVEREITRRAQDGAP